MLVPLLNHVSEGFMGMSISEFCLRTVRKHHVDLLRQSQNPAFRRTRIPSFIYQIPKLLTTLLKIISSSSRLWASRSPPVRLHMPTSCQKVADWSPGEVQAHAIIAFEKTQRGSGVMWVQSQETRQNGPMWSDPERSDSGFSLLMFPSVLMQRSSLWIF